MDLNSSCRHQIYVDYNGLVTGVTHSGVFLVEVVENTKNILWVNLVFDQATIARC